MMTSYGLRVLRKLKARGSLRLDYRGTFTLIGYTGRRSRRIRFIKQVGMHVFLSEIEIRNLLRNLLSEIFPEIFSEIFSQKSEIVSEIFSQKSEIFSEIFSQKSEIFSEIFSQT
jgi:hypothetical protein